MNTISVKYSIDDEAWVMHENEPRQVVITIVRVNQMKLVSLPTVSTRITYAAASVAKSQLNTPEFRIIDEDESSFFPTLDKLLEAVRSRAA